MQKWSSFSNSKKSSGFLKSEKVSDFCFFWEPENIFLGIWIRNTFFCSDYGRACFSEGNWKDNETVTNQRQLNCVNYETDSDKNYLGLGLFDK